MLTSVLPFTPEDAAKATEYCTEYSDGMLNNIKELWEWTRHELYDADKMSSPLQGATNKFLTQILQPRRILEISSYSGFKIEPRIIEVTKRTISRYGLKDRVKLIKGPARDSLKTLSGIFDIIFINADKEGYEGYIRQILDKKLLSPERIIICDNIFARGLTISTNSSQHLNQTLIPYWIKCGKAIKKLSAFCKEDNRINCLVLPLYDSICLLKWKS
ncbi:S-adenosyl-L-methionine-dependent methyltransferase [Diplogelasinospora grovesii]|uniref:S-adenosyl-L-methionine-dependent methyltransferase n=1 Tax=Diplogelasinospora grovesii TaxID=303347 RepID=A0AAN6RYW9_9PEZI|nr:S-adenosyl-L-methionine-dependent methyltransferase [Diplogelasinospora grovesii]